MSYLANGSLPAFRRILPYAVAAQVITGIGFAWKPDMIGQALAATAVFGALIHATFSYGSRNALALLAICFAVSMAIENIGVATGLPFGRYHFVVDAGLPRIGAIPAIVGFVWFGMGYFAWIVAAILIDDADLNLRSTINLVALPIAAAFVMTQWDFTMDRASSTIAGAWIWHDGGGDFGVPLTNYLGWFLTAWIFYQLFALYLAHNSAASNAAAPALRWTALLFYATAGLTHLTPLALGNVIETSVQVTDAAGRAWRIADMREMTVAVMLATMAFSSVLAGVKLLQNRTHVRSAGHR